jgi:hypothetical protein
VSFEVIKRIKSPIKNESASPIMNFESLLVVAIETAIVEKIAESDQSA